MNKSWAIVALMVLTLAQFGRAQTSSLYVSSPGAPEPTMTVPFVGRQPNYLSPALAQTSLSAVKLPPRKYELYDLITIIVREDTEAGSDASLDTKKEYNLDAELSDYPGIRVLDTFLNYVSKTDMKNDPKLGLKTKGEFKGDGQYSRKDTFTSRITSRIIDIKPNGTLVLEARKFIKSDKESLDMVITGTCRAEDVAVDNTVLSTQLYDLRLVKEHTGELRKTTKKGLLTKIFETIFAF